MSHSECHLLNIPFYKLGYHQQQQQQYSKLSTGFRTSLEFVRLQKEEQNSDCNNKKKNELKTFAKFIKNQQSINLLESTTTSHRIANKLKTVNRYSPLNMWFRLYGVAKQIISMHAIVWHTHTTKKEWFFFGRALNEIIWTRPNDEEEEEGKN